MQSVLLAIGLLFSINTFGETLFPGAPDEASDYAFLIGDWQCTYQQFNRQSEVVYEAPCTWQATYAFENKMVVDDFRMLDGQGKVTYAGRTLRTYSLQDKRWHQVFLPVQRSASLNPFVAQKVEGDMQLSVEMRQPSGEVTPGRFSFSYISENAFIWESRQSADNGASWVLESRITATR